ncbi:MAG: hypothetical protein KBD04_05885 [Proteobacteria bacterium]|nr:hypothetical protein [Pseudomonadota bacterium]
MDQEGISRIEIVIQAAYSLRNGQTGTDSAPTLEAYLLIPAQEVPKSIVEHHCP